jgi:hypothetical protein
MSRRLPPTLVLARALPSARQRAWAQDLVFFQLDEINGLVDVLDRRARDTDDQQLTPGRRRVARLLEAASWSPEMFIAGARAYLALGCARPEDVFGPALILLRLCAHEPDVARLVASLPPRVSRVLAQLGASVALVRGEPAPSRDR